MAHPHKLTPPVMWTLVILQPKGRNLLVASTQRMAIAYLPYLCDLHRTLKGKEKRLHAVLPRSNNETAVHSGFSLDMQTKSHV